MFAWLVAHCMVQTRIIKPGEEGTGSPAGALTVLEGRFLYSSTPVDKQHKFTEPAHHTITVCAFSHQPCWNNAIRREF